MRRRLQSRPKLWFTCLVASALIGAQVAQAANIDKNDSIDQPQPAVGDPKVATDQGEIDEASQLMQIVADHQQLAQQTQRLAGDFVINSLDNDLSFGRFTGNRHKYEPAAATTSTSTTTISPATSTTSTSTTPTPALLREPTDQKIEERNQHDDETPNQPHQDPTMHDHRPASTDQQFTSSAQSPAATVAPSAASQQQQAAPISWNVQQQPAHIQAYSVPQQQHQTFGSAAPNQQVITVQQHPTSINSIISDHHLGQQQQNQMASGGSQVLQTQQAGSLVAPNQPPPVIFLNSNGSMGARRISISNWLRGISSMLANIFNRRDHVNNQLIGQASGQLGHWVQLGPQQASGPQWLAQAQSGMQQFQQQPYATPSIGGSRYAFVPAQPQQQMTFALQPATSILQQSAGGYMASSGDLQASSSSLSHASIMSASSQATNANNQPQVSSSASSPQRQQHQMGSIQRQQQAVQPQAVVSKPPQVTTGNSTTATRYGRSLQSPMLSASSDQSLPLVHYSRYSD